MSETPQEYPADPTGPDEEFPPGGPLSDPESPDTPGTEGEPNEAEYEASADTDREAELLAERQEEEQSIEAQKREQDAQRKKLDQLAAHVAKRYSDILGSDLSGFVGCEMCSDYWPGIRLPIMPQPATVAAIKIAIGEDPDPPLNADNYSRKCDTCDGHGKVLTGSHVQGQKSATCYDCRGAGWIPVGNERASGGLTAADAPPTNGNHVLEAPAPAPLHTDEARTPEEERLRQLGAIVVWPPKPPDPVNLVGG